MTNLAKFGDNIVLSHTLASISIFRRLSRSFSALPGHPARVRKVALSSNDSLM